MVTESKTSFPMLPVSSWWAIRKKFQQTTPKEVTPSYLATVLRTSEASARKNVINYLKPMGIIDDEGRPTALANKWRFDDKYAEVCEEIISSIYPQELMDAIPNPAEERQAVGNWFASKTGLGKGAAQRMAALYILLSESDPSKGEKASIKGVRGRKAKPVKEPGVESKKVVQKEATIETKEHVGAEQQAPHIASAPSIHIDLQIHLSPEATADQIDQIFASMAKHFKEMKQI